MSSAKEPGVTFCSRFAPIVLATALVSLLSVPPEATAAQHDDGRRGIAASRADLRVGWLGPDGAPLPFSTHEQLEAFLRDADVVSMRELGGTTKPHKVLLERDGVRAHAIFRNFDLRRERIWIDGRFHMFFRDSDLGEVAAYRVARLLGVDAVPPTVRRTIDGEDGSLQLWIEQAMTNAERREKRMTPPEPWRWFVQRRLMDVFDNLIYNDDRHPGNILVDRDWNVWFIDHTRSFQRDPRLRDPDQITHVDRDLWRRLRETTDAAFRGSLDDVLSDSDIEVLLERRERLVTHIEELIAARGPASVLLGETSTATGAHR